MKNSFKKIAHPFLAVVLSLQLAGCRGPKTEDKAAEKERQEAAAAKDSLEQQIKILKDAEKAGNAIAVKHYSLPYQESFGLNNYLTTLEVAEFRDPVNPRMVTAIANVSGYGTTTASATWESADTASAFNAKALRTFRAPNGAHVYQFQPSSDTSIVCTYIESHTFSPVDLSVSGTNIYVGTMTAARPAPGQYNK